MKNILYITIIFFIFFGALESVSRLFLVVQQRSWGALWYGLRHEEYVKKLERVVPHDGGEAYYKSIPSADIVNPVNSRGFRGPEIGRKREGEVRIICLGGSTTYGTNIPYCSTYPYLLQQRLDAQRGKRQFRVINAGQPGLNLRNIISLLQDEILALDPDVLIIMSINNNFNADGFWYVSVGEAGEGINCSKNHKFLKKIRNIAVKKIAFASLIDKIGRKKILDEFDWDGFAQALMQPENVWQDAYRRNLYTAVQAFFTENPQGSVFLIGQAVNTVQYPSLAAPFSRAKKIMCELQEAFPGVYLCDVQQPILRNMSQGIQVWQYPGFDPLHLSGEGNRIVADAIFECMAKAHIF